ncbi:MAG: hypothetical protein RBQ80_07915 [Methanocorpusculum sp.]|nr:hypothetical protein [Methanocorpusculum sp.]
MRFDDAGNPAVPTLKETYKGWNAIGVYGDNPVKGKEMVSGLSDWRAIIYWDSVNQDYVTYIVNGDSGSRSPEKYVDPTVGYWVYRGDEGIIF